MRIYIAIIIILTSLKSLACTCALKKLSERQKSELENSECIFIGEVIEVNNSDLTYKIKVTESLDGGDSTENIYVGKNWKYCQPYVEKKGKWIVYGNMENGFLRMNMCGISRSFDYPILNPPPPPPELFEKQMNEKEMKNLFQKIRAENMKVALYDLKLEITAARKRRDDE